MPPADPSDNFKRAPQRAIRKRSRRAERQEIEAMIREDLTAAPMAIEEFSEMIDFICEDDPGARMLLATILDADDHLVPPPYALDPDATARWRAPFAGDSIYSDGP